MKDRNKELLGALAMDLKRAALSTYRGSDTTANRFFEEALARQREIDTSKMKPYLKELLIRVKDLQNIKDRAEKAEETLMYSTRFQNAALAL